MNKKLENDQILLNSWNVEKRIDFLRVQHQLVHSGWYQDNVVIESPDKKFALIIFDIHEATMMNYIGRPLLVKKEHNQEQSLFFNHKSWLENPFKKSIVFSKNSKCLCVHQDIYQEKIGMQNTFTIIDLYLKKSTLLIEGVDVSGKIGSAKMVDVQYLPSLKINDKVILKELSYNWEPLTSNSFPFNIKQ